jgi:hypothetical protein
LSRLSQMEQLGIMGVMESMENENKYTEAVQNVQDEFGCITVRSGGVSRDCGLCGGCPKCAEAVSKMVLLYCRQYPQNTRDSRRGLSKMFMKLKSIVLNGTPKCRSRLSKM